MPVRYEWEETRPDGSVETWDIELREFKKPTFHLYDEGCEDKHHPKMKCPVCGARVFDVETPSNKNDIQIVNLDWEKGGCYHYGVAIKFYCHRCFTLLGIQTYDESALQLYFPKTGLLLAE